MAIFLYFLLFLLKKIQNINYLKLSFERNLTSLTTENIMQKIYNNDIYTNIKIGSHSQEIPITYKMNSFPFYIISSDSQSKTNKVYDYQKSKSFTKFTNDSKINFEGEEFLIANTASDTISLPYTNFKNLDKFQFLITSKLNDQFIINEGGTFGLFIDSAKESYENIDFVSQLKKRKLIDGYSFYFKFPNKNKDKGEIIIGARPDQIDQKNYNYSHFKSENCEFEVLKQFWSLRFDTVKYNNNTFLSDNIYFQIEKGVIVAPREIKVIMNNKFFNNYDCSENNFQSNDLGTEYNFISCKDNIKIEKFGNLTFYHKKLNSTFILNHEDLFYYFKGRYYFLVVFHNEDISNYWIFGSPFFKKYEIIFDKDKGTIGVYDTINKDSSFDWKILIIIFLIFLSGGLVFYIIFYLFKKKRKIRANELEDNYEYISQ